LLVENVVKHNIISAASPLNLEIKTTSEQSISVINQLQPKTKGVHSTGHGLQSIDDRYTLLTGKKISITKTSEYFCVTLPLISPLEYEGINN
jgi:two-component system LytT family sensor kinase